jgi:hypothetical protein
VGTAVGAIGAMAGALLALPGVSKSRTMRLLFAMVIGRNNPIGGTNLDWVDRQQPVVDDPAGVNARFMRWLFATHIADRRRWVVVVGLIAGAMIGAAITIKDIVALQNGGQGLMLPLPGAKDSLQAQAVLMSIACSIWSGAVLALAAAPAYRRMIVFAVLVAACLGSAIGFAAEDGRGAGPFALVVAATTAAAALALGVGSFDPEDVERSAGNYKSPPRDE